MTVNPPPPGGTGEPPQPPPYNPPPQGPPAQGVPPDPSYTPPAAPQQPPYAPPPQPGYQPPQQPGYQPPQQPGYQPPQQPGYPPAGQPGYPPPQAQPGQGQWPTQPPAAPAQYGQQPYAAPSGAPSGPAARPAFDPKTIDPMDWGILGCGFLILIFSFFSYYKYSVSAKEAGITFSQSGTVSAWHGFFGWFGAIVALASAAVLAIALFAPSVRIPYSVRLIVLGGFALATLCIFLALFIVPGDTGGLSGLGVSIDKGHGFSYWVSLILVIVGLALSFLRLRATGGKLPWEKSAPST